VKNCISNVLRKYSSMLVVEDEEEDKKKDRSQLSINTKVKDVVPKVHMSPLAQTAMPEKKAPRRQLNYKKKITDDTKGQYMQDYMKKYRLEGKDTETLSPKSKYVKKPKIRSN